MTRAAAAATVVAESPNRLDRAIAMVRAAVNERWYYIHGESRKRPAEVCFANGEIMQIFSLLSTVIEGFGNVLRVSGDL